MPNKIRYLFGPPIITGAKARKTIERLVADCQKSCATEAWVKEFKVGKDWRTAAYNFDILRKVGYLGKNYFFKVFRERTHVRPNNSVYRAFLQEFLPKPKTGSWTFHFGTWYDQKTCWAAELLKAAGFYIQFHPEDEGSWSIFKWPLGYTPSLAMIVNKKVLDAKAVAKQQKGLFTQKKSLTPSDIAPSAG